MFKVNENANLHWHLVFGLIMLRMLSFNLELERNFNSKTEEPYEKISTIENIQAEEKKIEFENNSLNESEYLKILSNSSVDLSEFNLLNYFVYIFYAPVYFSGPIILFNSFVNQINKMFINNDLNSKDNYIINQNTKQISKNQNGDFLKIKQNYLIQNKNPIKFKNKFIYLLRYVFVVVCFEIFNRYIYVNLYLTNPNNSFILKNDKFNYYSYSLFCFFLLIFIWFKFTIIWRTARIWCMFDDILTEENMNRCMYNNYCFEGFWRAWHRSFNVWLIRYIFIPLGGSSYKFLNVWIVFTFVALWHDLQMKLLLWGWFICFFMIPEIFVKNIFNQEKVIYL